LNFIQKIADYLNNYKKNGKPLKGSDEILGLWENDLDDGSGLHGIWGWSFRFNQDGLGIYSYWSDSKLEKTISFDWIRLHQRSIKTKYTNEVEWSKIDYTIKIIDAPYQGKLLKLTDNNYKSNDYSKDGFWGFSGAIFKSIECDNIHKS